MNSGKQRPLIVLMTDFGLQDTYIGVMKGVIAGISPAAQVIDLTHGISPQNILQGSLLLGSSAPYFPDGAIFVAVVDPGVGTARKAIALVTEKQVFISPDNGLLTSVMKQQKIAACYTITNPACMLEHQSATFHGRDLFSPAAAHLANGLRPSALGNALDPEECKRIDLPENTACDDGKSWEGEILYCDVYGNLITSFTNDMVMAGDRSAQIRLGNGRTLPMFSTFGDAAEGQALAYKGSGGFVEIAVRNGNGARELELQAGDRVTLLIGAS